MKNRKLRISLDIQYRMVGRPSSWGVCQKHKVRMVIFIFTKIWQYAAQQSTPRVGMCIICKEGNMRKYSFKTQRKLQMLLTVRNWPTNALVNISLTVQKKNLLHCTEIHGLLEELLYDIFCSLALVEPLSAAFFHVHLPFLND